MKKLSILILIFIYFLSASGIGIKQNYCCGKLTSVYLSFTQLENSNSKCKNGVTGNCCKSKFKSFKVNDTYNVSFTISSAAKNIVDLNNFNPDSNLLKYTKLVKTAYANHAPPLHYGIPIYILNCVYRI